MTACYAGMTAHWKKSMGDSVTFIVSFYLTLHGITRMFVEAKDMFFGTVMTGQHAL
jgi:hypothetical protein